MNFAEAFDRLLRGRLHRAAVGDVDGDRMNPVTGALQILQCAIEVILRTVCDHDLHAGIGERPCDPEAYAAVTARNKSNLTRDIPQRGRLDGRTTTGAPRGFPRVCR